MWNAFPLEEKVTVSDNLLEIHCELLTPPPSNKKLVLNSVTIDQILNQ